MRKLLLGTVGLMTMGMSTIGMSASAFAGDFPAPAYTKAPVFVMPGLRLERLLHRCQRRLGIEPVMLGLHHAGRRLYRCGRLP